MEIAHSEQDFALAERRLRLREAGGVDLGFVAAAGVVGRLLARVGEGFEGLGDPAKDSRRIVAEILQSHSSEYIGMKFLGGLEIGSFDVGCGGIRSKAECVVVVELRQLFEERLDLDLERFGGRIGFGVRCRFPSRGCRPPGSGSG